MFMFLCWPFTWFSFVVWIFRSLEGDSPRGKLTRFARIRRTKILCCKKSVISPMKYEISFTKRQFFFGSETLLTNSFDNFFFLFLRNKLQAHSMMITKNWWGNSLEMSLFRVENHAMRLLHQKCWNCHRSPIMFRSAAFILLLGNSQSMQCKIFP